MNHTEHLTYFVAKFVDELVRNGITNVVISPGSRSTPLALAFAEHKGIQHWMNLDERSASFFALGMAKEQNKPVALLCTSGTAAANYFPAIIEAYYSRVPLIVLTADRPPELRDVGAPQAIDQIKMYHDYVKWFHEMALPDADNGMLEYVRRQASRAVYEASRDNAGPVHLNFPFREPLLINFTLPNIWNRPEINKYHYIEGKRKLDSSQLQYLENKIRSGKRGLLVCGPQMNVALRKAIFTLASSWNIPILADPLSQLRTGISHDDHKDLLIEGYDSILKSEKIRKRLKPDFIIRFGAMPVSKPYLFFVEENKDVPHFVVEDYEGFREPALHQTDFIYSDTIDLCEKLSEWNVTMDPEWTSRWSAMNQIVKDQWTNLSATLTEGHVVTVSSKVMENEHILFVGNSMPIRDVDTFFIGTQKDIRIMGNRGANGIDGIVSTAVGASAHGKKVTLLIGDLTFFHDQNGLLAAKQYHLDLTIVLINNNGGGIFSFLPQSGQSDHFEVLFGTPLHIDFKHIAHLYDGTYVKVESWEHLEESLRTAYTEGGIHLIEVRTNREENVLWHRKEWKQIEEKILQILGE
jgi:2-succinyl-5-enolpyruvyl-6-hydroxy-3-cyclohexene-1-carboxylate synthase